MNNAKHPFVFEYSEDSNFSEYLGADGLPTAKTYASYLETCEEFKTKARRYAKDNLRLRNSSLHLDKCGYESSQQLEQEILSKREQQLSEYRKHFDAISDGDLNLLNECLSGRSKKVRVIKELPHKNKGRLSNEFEKKRSSWFTRYCILSRFIQAVRKVILLKRLEKALIILTASTSETKHN